MAVSVNDVTKIKAGQVKAFACDTPKQAKSGQSTVSYVKKFCREEMPSDVADYKTEVQGNTLIVTAVKKD